MSLILSEKAKADIINISNYTLENWGYAQAKKYIALIEVHLQTIQNNPDHVLSKDRSNIYPNCRSLKAERHIIFYRLKEDRIEIIRILHETMDYEKHLGE